MPNVRDFVDKGKNSKKPSAVNWEEGFVSMKQTSRTQRRPGRVVKTHVIKTAQKTVEKEDESTQIPENFPLPMRALCFGLGFVYYVWSKVDNVAKKYGLNLRK